MLETNMDFILFVGKKHWNWKLAAPICYLRFAGGWEGLLRYQASPYQLYMEL